MKISVVVPTYKPQHYLEECLQSLERQTLDKQHYEVIIVLNGCGEPWLGQVKAWLRQFTMNTVLIHTETPGVSHARNMGIDCAKGEFLTFIDDDDWVSEPYLQSLLERASQQKPTVVTSNVIGYRDETGEYIPDYYLARLFNRIHTADGEASLLQGRSFLSSSCFKLIPRKLIGGRCFNTKYQLGEDALFMATLTDGFSSVATAAPDAIYYRRLRTNSASHADSRQTFAHLLANALSLAWAYTRVYLQHPFRYNPLFFATRILAGFTKRLFCYN